MLLVNPLGFIIVKSAWSILLVRSKVPHTAKKNEKISRKPSLRLICVFTQGFSGGNDDLPDIKLTHASQKDQGCLTNKLAVCSLYREYKI